MKNSLLAHQRRRLTLAPSLVALWACATPGLSQADLEDPLNFSVGSSIRYDDNLFRLPAGSTLPASGRSSKADLIYTLQGGLHVDKPYALQRLQLDLTATQYSYRNNSYLNASALDYRAAWLWSLTPRLTGSLSADKVSTPISYADLQSALNDNMRENSTQRFTLDWWVDDGWHVVGGADLLRSQSEGSELTATGNFDQKALEGGIKFVSAAHNSVTALRREIRGDYIGRPLSYEQSDSELRAIWQLNGLSLLEARVGYTDRTYSLAQRNYSGTNGVLSYRLTPTGKLQLTLSTGRDLVPYLEANHSYFVSDYIALTPAWQVSDKTTLSLRLNTSRNDFRGAIVPTLSMREDKVRSAQLSAAWRPARAINVDGYITHEQRTSNLSDLPYRDNIVGVGAMLRF